MDCSACSVFLIVMFGLLFGVGWAHPQHNHRPYLLGEDVKMECMDKNGKWGPGPVCKESGKEMTFKYGVDVFQYCAWGIDSDETYQHLKALINRDQNWSCRIRMIPDVDFFLPFSIPVWGIVEEDHIHVDNHLNFIFHADAGKIIAVACYPMRDHFQMGKLGSMLMMHGPVKWFAGATFTPLNTNSNMAANTAGAFINARPPANSNSSLVALVLLYLFLGVVIAFVLSFLLYHFYIRPRLVAAMASEKEKQS